MDEISIKYGYGAGTGETRLYDKLKNSHKIYLKNFDSENSTTIELEDENEFSQFQDYINDLKMS